MVLALGGNAIIPAEGTGTIEEQIEVTRSTARQMVEVVQGGTQLIVTHGNGPVVGNIVIRNEAARDIVPPMPLDICGADSQGGLGYMIQQVFRNELEKSGISKTVVTVITQVVVDPEDPAFREPTKPIGPFYTRTTAENIAAEKGWVMTEDAGRGYRRVVPSPRPLEIVESEVVGELVRSGKIVIAAGGGGIPVVRDRDGSLSGVEAVIDKDFSSGVLAAEQGVEALVMVTAVPKVALRFGKPDQLDVDLMSAAEAGRYLEAGEFPPGSMGPKIEAAIDFLNGGGREVVIASHLEIALAIQGRAGTRIIP
ncbi:MAG: carbamate kinase [Candidatus Eiseniibacteriota bacterium]|nr:MAG: carbamate kinase [Candidatus Eisenbacteria bacterium]